MDPEARYEKVDPTPVEVPAFYRKPPTIKEELQRYVRYEISAQAKEEGFETFEEFEDFGPEWEPEDDDWYSNYEFTELDEETIEDAHDIAEDVKARSEPEPTPPVEDQSSSDEGGAVSSDEGKE